MRVLLVRVFQRWRRKQRIVDATLVDAIERAERGLIDADIGGGLIKQRVARPGAGKSGGFRTIVAYRAGDRAVFLLGFAKNEQDNVGDDVLADLRKAAAAALRSSDAVIAVAIEDGELLEIDHGE